jgi:hypothetical protein
LTPIFFSMQCSQLSSIKILFSYPKNRWRASHPRAPPKFVAFERKNV